MKWKIGWYNFIFERWYVVYKNVVESWVGNGCWGMDYLLEFKW